MKKNENFWLDTWVALKAIGHPVRKMREAIHKLGPSQTEQAEKLGMGRRAYNNYIQGIRKDRDQQERMAGLWPIPPKEFFADTYKKRKK
jgi:transcriptional regulator with XRE-family HTH domain